MPRRLLVAVAVALVVAAAASVVWWQRRGPDLAPARLASSTECARAAQRSPPALGGLERHDLDVAGAAVYGDPAVIVRCGVDAPAPTSDACVDVDGVDWVVHDLADGTRLTTYGRQPAIQVLVPATHGPAPLLVPALTSAATALPHTGHRCIGS